MFAMGCLGRANMMLLGWGLALQHHFITCFADACTDLYVFKLVVT